MTPPIALGVVRRKALSLLLGAVAGLLGVAGCNEGRTQVSEEEKRRREEEWTKRAHENARRAEEEEARDVESRFSTKPILVRMGGREWLIPANYFNPKGRDKPDSFDLDYFGFHLFLPDYGGFDKENWRDPFDSREVHVFDVSSVDKTQMIRVSGGETRLITPAEYGDVQARFANLRSNLEAHASFRAHGLVGYRDLNPDSPILWTGTRSNGEFFFFKATLAPGEKPPPGRTNPLCQADYYSEKEDLRVAYRYSQQNFAKWLEIDDAIWQKLHQWRVK